MAILTSPKTGKAGIMIDTAKYSGCGHCMAACSEAAQTSPMDIPPSDVNVPVFDTGGKNFRHGYDG